MENDANNSINLDQGSFTNLIHRIQAGIALIDRDYQLTYVSPGLAGLLGYSEQEVLNQPIAVFTTPNHFRFLQMKLNTARFGEYSFAPISFVHKDNRQVECLVLFSKGQSGNGTDQETGLLIFDLRNKQDLGTILDKGDLQKARELLTLNRVMTNITRTWDLEQLLNLVFSSIETITGFDGGGFFVYRSEDLTLFSYPDGRFIKIPGGMIHRLRKFRNERPELFDNKVWVLSNINPSPEDIQLYKAFFNLINPGQSETMNAVLVFSLKDNIRTNGIFGFFHESESAFTPKMVEMAEIITSHAAIAIENMTLIRESEILAKEKERLRLSLELHDSVAQGLYSIMLYGEASRMALTSNKIEVVEKNLEEMNQLAREAMRDLRLLIFELRPPLVKEVGFFGAIMARLEAVEKRSGCIAECHVYGEAQLSTEVENELYWIAHEGLNNVLKHAKADHLCVDIHFSNTRTLIVIQDDGVGFSISAQDIASGNRLKSISERVAHLGGKLMVDSKIGQGTKLEIIIDNK